MAARGRAFLIALIGFFLSIHGSGLARASSLPYDPATTFVVDMKGNGNFSSINDALGAIRTAGDASFTKPYLLLIVPSATAYLEQIDISGLSWTTIRGLGGSARVNGLVGCATAQDACDNVTIEYLSFFNTVQIGSLAADGTSYEKIRLHRVEIEGGPLIFGVSTASSAQRDFELSESRLTGRSPD